MKVKTFIPRAYFCNSLQLNLSEFGSENPTEKCIKRLMKDAKSEFNKNYIEIFVIYTFEYAQIMLKDYSSKFSKHTYTNAVKFTILALKNYLNLTYRKICDLLDLSRDIRKILKISKVPHYSTLQKFFKNLPTKILHNFNDFIVNIFVNKCEIIALDGSGFTSDHADKYYAIIRKKERKSYIKCHIAIDVDTRLILHFQTQRGPRHDTKFADASLRKMKRFKSHYIVCDKAYDTENIRTIINEEINAFDIIPNKTNVKTGYFRKRSRYVFRKPIYNRRNNVESVFSVIKRHFSGINSSRSTKLLNKETKLKCLIYNIYRSIQLNQK